MVAQQSSSKRIAVVSLGGTITMTAQAEGGVVPSLTSKDLLASLQPAVSGLEIEPITLRKVAGAHLRPQDLVELAHHIDGLAAKGYAGVVVTQGTDTIEETAFVLDLIATQTMPIVVTGAMRHADAPGADGPANLSDAIAVAASGDATRAGVTVALDGQIHSARFVHKAGTSSVGAFRSTPTGPIGWVSEGIATFALSPVARLSRIPVAQLGPLPNVAALKASMGEEGDLAETAVERGCAGLVIEGMGAGHVPSAFADRLEKIATKIPVVLSTRVTGGEVLRRTYGFVGSEIDLLRRGIILGGWLQTAKARLLLTLLLAADHDRTRIATCFQAYGGLANLFARQAHEGDQ